MESFINNIETIRHLETKLTNAECSGDESLLNELLSESYCGILSSGIRASKSDFIRMFCASGLKFKKLGIENLVFYEHGTSITVIGRSIFEATAGIQTIHGSGQFMDIWQLNDSTWKLSHSTVTPEKK